MIQDGALPLPFQIEVRMVDDVHCGGWAPIGRRGETMFQGRQMKWLLGVDRAGMWTAAVQCESLACIGVERSDLGWQGSRCNKCMRYTRRTNTTAQTSSHASLQRLTSPRGPSDARACAPGVERFPKTAAEYVMTRSFFPLGMQ
jgi:hypothetical protein